MKVYWIVAAVATAAGIKINKYDGPLPAQYDPKEQGDSFMHRIIRTYGD